MDIRQTPLIFSVPLGRWFGVDVRLSVWFLALIFVVCVRLGFHLGLYVSAILFASILIHEFAHIFGARQTGGEGSEILMWPLGGLAFVSPASSFYSEFWTTAAGPISNAILCLVCLPAVVTSGAVFESLQPVVLPTMSGLLSPDSWETFLTSFFVLVFAINFKLFVLNLLPIYPLDGGQIAFFLAKLRWDRGVARLGTLYMGGILAMLLLFAGLYVQSTSIIFVVSVLLMFVLQLHMTTVFAQRFGEAGVAYGIDDGDDFYKSAYDYDEDEDEPPKLNWFERRRARKQEQKLRREAEQRAETSERVDQLLEKINTSGYDSLSESEKRFLQKASTKYRTQGE